MAIAKEHLILPLQAELGLSRRAAQPRMGCLFTIRKDALSRGEALPISGFGEFLVKQKNSRRGRNPHTQVSMILAARQVLTCKSSGVLRHRLNQGLRST